MSLIFLRVKLQIIIIRRCKIRRIQLQFVWTNLVITKLQRLKVSMTADKIDSVHKWARLINEFGKRDKMEL